jgi:hypothetical protein
VPEPVTVRVTAVMLFGQEIIMRSVPIMIGNACVLLSLAVVPVSPRAADVPAYFNEIVATQTATPAEIGTKDVPQPNTTMFELYGCRAGVPQRAQVRHRIARR